MIDPHDIKKVRRQVDKATKAACRSTYKPSGGRQYSDVYTDSLARCTSFEAMREARELSQLAGLGQQWLDRLAIPRCLLEAT